MKALLLVILFSLSSQLFAQMTPEEKKEIYLQFCSNSKEFKAYAKTLGIKPTKEVILEISKTRDSIFKVVENGQKAVDELQNSSGEGIMAVILVCGVIDTLSNEFESKSCYNLMTNKAVVDRGGVAACKNIMSKLPKDN